MLDRIQANLLIFWLIAIFLSLTRAILLNIFSLKYSLLNFWIYIIKTANISYITIQNKASIK